MSSPPFRPTLGLPTLGLAAMGLFAPAAAQTPAPLAVPEVDVQGIGGRSYQGDAAIRPGPRSATPLAEAPQTVTVVPRELMEERVGAHVDNAMRQVRATGHTIRTDVSCTLFLSDPGSYDGGELVVQDTYGEQRVKLPAGSAVTYPATSLHRVEPVPRGSRMASFFWIQSMVRDDMRRRLLFDMDMARPGDRRATRRSPAARPRPAAAAAARGRGRRQLRDGGAGAVCAQVSKQFFFEKKNQKTFIPRPPGEPGANE